MSFDFKNTVDEVSIAIEVHQKKDGRFAPEYALERAVTESRYYRYERRKRSGQNLGRNWDKQNNDDPFILSPGQRE